MVENKTQVEHLIDHFKKKRTITSLEARTLYRVESLPRRILDLKERGFRFERSFKKDLTGKRYAVYRMVRHGYTWR